MWPTLKEAIKLLRAELDDANLQNEKLDLEIRLARAQRGIQEKELELERLKDPNEPSYPARLDECCGPCVRY